MAAPAHTFEGGSLLRSFRERLSTIPHFCAMQKGTDAPGVTELAGLWKLKPVWL
jgi:hypothetical protein